MMYRFGTGLAPHGFLRTRRPPPYRHGPRARALDVALGARLREARLLAGASRQQLGQAIGVGAGTVRRYETGARRIGPARLVAAARFLGLPLSWFFPER
jgi:DNA-binding XRE family transcriptional regulator